VLKEGTVIAVGGIAVGVVGGFVMVRVVSAYVQQLDLPGVLPLAGAALGLEGAAITASLMPAARASRVDAMQALRAD
jgi:ABC-type antimicrobial peptide transport system permease subunit